MLTLRQKLIARSDFIKKARAYFDKLGLLEVDTPLLRSYSVSDPYMSVFSVISSSKDRIGYLQSSPEYAMKMLLCEAVGDIYQLSKMFRAEEKSPIHSAEFTMLEWYRVGYDHDRLIAEVCEFIMQMIGDRKVEKVDYRELFVKHLGIDPFTISLSELVKFAEKKLGELPKDLLFDNYLTLFFSEIIEPTFDPQNIVVVKNYPASQASLSKVAENAGSEVAERFEVYVAGMELANGFNELTNAEQHLCRFEEDNNTRKILGKEQVKIDPDFIASLKKGLPECAGVALGLDRLLMIKSNASNIDQVITLG